MEKQSRRNFLIGSALGAIATTTGLSALAANSSADLGSLSSSGFLGPHEKPEVFSTAYHHWTPFQVEGYKLILDELVTEAGVEVRFFTKVIDAEANPEKGMVDGVFLHNIEGYKFARSKAYIDCTGDAVLSSLCGAKCREEYELNFEDYKSRREFPDQIGIFNKSVDIHAYNDSLEEFNRYEKEYEQTAKLNPGEFFGIPYSILVPKGWLNLWVAGRCNSSDIKVNGSIRVQPAASMMGQAAGTAAVQSIKTGQPACDLNTETLISTLRTERANLPQKKLSTKMTRA